MVRIVPVIDLSLDEGRQVTEVRDFLKSFFNGKPSKSMDYNSCAAYGSGKARSIKIRINALEREYHDFFQKS